MKGTHVHFENKIPAPLPVLPVLVHRAPRSEFESAAQTPTLCTLAEELSLNPSYPGSVGRTLLSRISKAEPQAWNLSMGLFFKNSLGILIFWEPWTYIGISLPVKLPLAP